MKQGAPACSLLRGRLSPIKGLLPPPPLLRCNVCPASHRWLPHVYFLPLTWLLQASLLYFTMSILPALVSYVPVHASTLRLPAILVSRISVIVMYASWSLSWVQYTVDFQQVRPQGPGRVGRPTVTSSARATQWPGQPPRP